MLESFEKSIKFKFFFITFVAITFKLDLVTNNELRNNDDLKKLFASLMGHMGVLLFLLLLDRAL